MNENTKRILEERIEFSNSKLEKVRSEVGKIQELDLLSNTCVYVTGSFARKEATEKSDLDLFFVSKENNSISKLNKTLVDAELIKLNKKLGFDDFSNDGEYLEIHSLDEIKQIGSQDEDSKNYFTARMLLLLESTPIYNDCIYDEVINSVIESYLRDFHDHEKEFKPIFLVNDILRYWKTLCLNYEHKRNRVAETNTPEEKKREIKLKAHLKNLKLQFSRKYTCFSFILALVSDYISNGVIINHDSIKAIVKKTPTEIFYELYQNDKVKEDVSKALDCYAYFLELNKQDDNWLDESSNRDEAFTKSREFGVHMYAILTKLIEGEKTDILRYIVL